MAKPICDYCHQKPQYSNHKFCSKTCAAQAAAVNNSNMCSQCHKKPKFQNFEFCGKTCAAQALAQRQASAVQRTTNSNVIPAAQQSQPPMANPMQVAHLLAQQIPQVQSFLATVNGSSGAHGIPPMNQVSGVPQNGPFLQQQVPMPPASGTAAPASSKLPPAAQQLPVSQQPATPPECFIPGCGKLVHTDANGLKTSDYCSQRHREEAVSSGLVDACIMCLRFPQGDKDYFCSRMCRDEAMAKLPQ